MKKLIITFLILTISGIFIFGCSQETLPSGTQGDQLNLNDQFGGYDAVEEDPAFGDEEISANFPEPEAAEAELNDFASLNAIQADSGVLVYSLRILWGMLEYDSTIVQPTDWSGTLVLDTGCIKVINKVLFERGQDYFIRPRINPQTLSWTSFTTVHYDGILVFLYFREADVDPATTEVSFETGPYSRTFTLTELESLSEVIVIDDLGNSVAIEAQKLERLECPEGVMEGRWIKCGNSREGRFYGRFISLDGIFMGHIKGHFGTRPDGEQLFFGKWINRAGYFRGFLKGTWGYDLSTDATESTGWYDGNYYSSNSNKLGTLNGIWVSSHRGSMPNSGATDKVPKFARGFFHGTWKQYCD